MHWLPSDVRQIPGSNPIDVVDRMGVPGTTIHVGIVGGVLLVSKGTCN